MIQLRTGNWFLKITAQRIDEKKEWEKQGWLFFTKSRLRILNLQVENSQPINKETILKGWEFSTWRLRILNLDFVKSQRYHFLAVLDFHFWDSNEKRSDFRISKKSSMFFFNQIKMSQQTCWEVQLHPWDSWLSSLLFGYLLSHTSNRNIVYKYTLWTLMLIHFISQNLF